MIEELLQAIDVNRVHVLKYEDRKFQDKVLQVLPLARLHEAAVKTGNSNGLTFHEHFMIEVMRWFKKEFFTWVDCKPCVVCGSPSQNGEPLTPTSEDLSAGATRVENHQCPKCGLSQRFPRYNCPSKLLDTHEGRCGEWANCFTGICRALGYDARYVYDVTDHVWTEVFSPHLDRWVHVDSCENAWDRPLVYEQGWKKQLSYVIAFSKDEVVDVTFRYTLDPSETKPRRVQETAVLNKILSVNKLFFRHSPQKQQLLTQRLAKEIMAMLVKPNSNTGGEVYGGRESGSTEWRQGRGEGGTATHLQLLGGTVIRAGDAATHSLSIRYHPAGDRYLISRDGAPAQVSESFNSLVYKNEGVIRKVEHDWNMVYLARAENSPESVIEWRIECSKPIKSASISMSHSTFHEGQVMWTCDLNGETSTFHPQFSDINLSKLNGATAFSITAKLSCQGREYNNWQHTQLFRTGLGGNDTPFQVYLVF